MRLALWLGPLCLMAGGAKALYEGMYCGKQSCYDALGVKRDTPRKEIGRVYRRLQRERHPDKNPEALHDPVKYKQLEQEWHRIRIAYETLKDEGSRRDYDFLLDNPDEFFRHWWYYHRTRVSQQINVWAVVFSLVSLISLGQYYLTNWSYWHSLSAILSVDDKIFRHYVNRAERDGHGPLLRDDKGKLRSRVDQKNVILQLYGEEMALEAHLNFRNWREVMWCNVLTYPYWLPLTVQAWCRWFYRRLRGIEYNEEEKKVLTRKALAVSRKVWANYSPEQQEELIGEELWVPDNLSAYKEREEDKAMRSYLSPAQMKRYRKQKKRQ